MDVEKSRIPQIVFVTLNRIDKLPAPTVQVAGRDFFSLTYREGGCVTVKSARGALLSEPQSVTYVPRGLSYETEVRGGGVMYVLHVYLAEGETLFGDKPLCARPADPARFAERFARAYAAFTAEGASYFCMSLVMRLLGMAEEVFSPSRSVAPPRLRQAKQYMDESFTDTTLRMADYAAVRGVSEVYFRREFKSFYGVSPLEYIKRKRVDAAARMLETGLCSVTEAALQSGFESLSYFSAEFRRLLGQSPSQYAKDLS